MARPFIGKGSAFPPVVTGGLINESYCQSQNKKKDHTAVGYTQVPHHTHLFLFHLCLTVKLFLFTSLFEEVANLVTFVISL